MNGRLYDPLLRRFLNADENIQDPYNSQNYNKYGYVLNNPLMFSDPSGEVFFLIPLVGYFWSAVIVGAVIGAASYLVSSAIMGQAITLKGFLKSTFWGAVSGAVTFGIGSIFSSATTQMLTGIGSALEKSIGTVGLEIVRAGTHAVAQGVMSLMQGGSFQQAFWSGALGSLGAYAFGAAVGSDFANKTLGQITFGALSGGIGAELTGGNFWQGAVIGGIVAGLNATMHEIDSPLDDGEDPKKNKPKVGVTKKISKDVTYRNFANDEITVSTSSSFTIGDSSNGEVTYTNGSPVPTDVTGKITLGSNLSLNITGNKNGLTSISIELSTKHFSYQQGIGRGGAYLWEFSFKSGSKSTAYGLKYKPTPRHFLPAYYPIKNSYPRSFPIMPPMGGRLIF